MEKIGRRMEDVGMWAREESEGIGSSYASFERSHRKENVTSLVSRS
jgi:hypothetical protein